MNKHYRQSRCSFAAAIVLTFIFSSPLIAQETLEGIARIKVNEALATQLEARAFSRSSSGEIVTGIHSVDQLNRQFNVRRFTRVFPYAGKNEARHRSHGLHLWYEISIDKSIPVSQLIRSYQSEAQILKAEPVYKKSNFGSHDAKVVVMEEPRAGAALPDASNDPLLSDQWHYNNTGQTGGDPGADIRLFEAWRTETGSKNVIVAVIDGGIQTNHQDLAANMWVNSGEIRGNGVDDDNNGYVDDIHGYDFANNTAKILPDDHGTHVAGTIAAVSNNGLGVAGVAGGSGNGDGVSLMSCSVFNDEVSGGFAEAYVYSADNGAVISQNSWGYTAPDVFEQVVLDAIDYFIEEAGKDEYGRQIGPMDGGIVIFSAGNFSDESKYYPAFYEPVLAVASSTHKDIRAEYSNFGSWVDITAPGGETYQNDNQGVISTLPGDKYGSFMGTSMACPHVSGVAALIVSEFYQTGLRPHAVRQKLLQSVDDIGAANAAFTGKLGSGRINAASALRQNSIAPLPVKDLAVVKKSVGEITLGWTNPGDENDFVAEYDLRYSASPITESNFTRATRATAVPVPQATGSREVSTITNLPGGVLFYFALRSKDFHGNVSSLSNVVSEKSALTPTVAILPTEIRQDLKTAGRATKTFTISNTGQGTLEFSIEEPDENGFSAVTPLQGSVLPGASATISVTFNASEHYAGIYSQEIVIETNDPANKTVVVTLTMRVTDNGSPIASVSTTSIEFASVQIGATQRKKVMISNAGSHDLSIKTITSNTDAFSAETITPVTIAPFHSQEITLNFSPVATGSASGLITLHTNDPANASIILTVKGEGLQQAPVVASPGLFNETLTQGTSVSRKMVLRNNSTRSRRFRIEVTNNREINGDTKNATGADNGRVAARNDSSIARREQIQARHRVRLAAKSPQQQALAMAISPASGHQTRSDGHARKSTSSFDRKTYQTGFENFPDGAPGIEGWYSTHSWAVVSENADRGERHLRGTKDVTGEGANVALSPYLFEMDEYEYPQYTTASMRLNLDRAKGTSWEVVPQDPWSYVATRIRFNADGTVEAMVIDHEYEFHWKKIAAKIPSGYFDLAVEYNGFGSDTSGFPTYNLFINNYHVFSGTGLASAIGQVAFVSGMETEGPAMDIDEFRLLGDEFIPTFIQPQPREGVINAGQSVNIDLEFDATVMKTGSYESDIVIYLDEADSLIVPASLTTLDLLPGSDSDGSIVQEVWTNIPGKHITSIPLTTVPDATNFLSSLEAPSDAGDQYGSRIRGYIVAPVDGNYTFWIASNDNSELWLSPDESVASKRLIASVTGYTNPRQWTKYPTQTSEGVALKADQKYYFEVLHKEGVGSDHLAVGWRLPDGTLERPIAGLRLLPYNNTGHQDPPLCSASGTITRAYWTDIPGAKVADIPLNAQPDGVESLTIFEGPVNIGSHYGARMQGYICPPATGEYVFWIASNDHSELWLSTDADPSNKTKIAFVSGATAPREWQKYPSQKSVAITLTKGESYYVEALHKQGVGSDHLAVGWQLPDGTMERPIAGTHLSPVKTNEAFTDFQTQDQFYAQRAGADDVGIEVYPNPVKGEKLSVVIRNVALTQAVEKEVSIRQLTGRTVYSSKEPCAEGCDTQIDIVDYDPGIYILQVRLGHRTFTEKLIVP